ncbi:hypothetical protein AGMMS49942_23450 [Spirochaetia bacterium]|nr:hypothetical protein AGMMS49942_23450 [Spirochaetia bacterium]
MNENNLAKNSIFNTIGVFVYFFFQWVSTILVVRFSDFTEAGVYSLAISFTNIFAVISSFGVRGYQISDVSHRHTDGTYIAARITSNLLSWLLFIVALIFVRFSNYILLCCIAMMCFKGMESASDVFAGIMQKLNRYDAIALSNILKGLIPIIFFCIALFLKNLIWGIGAMATAYLLVLLFYDMPVIMHNKGFTRSISLQDILHILRVSFPLMFFSLVYPYMTFITRNIVKDMYSGEELGYYSSVTILIVVMLVLTGAIWTVFMPQMSALYSNREYGHLKKNMLQIVCRIAVLSIVLLIAGFLLGNMGLGLLFGKEILLYSFLLPPVIIVSSILTLVNFFNSALIAFQKRNKMLIANLIGAVFCTLLLRPLVTCFGMAGSLYCLIISMGIQLVLLTGITIITLGKKDR